MKDSRVRELYQRYEGGLEKWQIKLALARLKRFRVPPDAWEDAMQELALEIQQFRFDPDKAHAASERTILCRRLDNRIRMLARANARRQAAMDALADLAPATEDDHQGDRILAESEIRDLVAGLSPDQQLLCKALMGGASIYGIARATGRHYETVRREAERIRDIFTGRGFDQWFE